MTAYYNEIDPYAAAWLRELIREGLIAEGEVDERSITDVQPSDLRGFEQCHFFAGIGGWSYALRLAGWPDDRPAWTGSCPCQPFSAAGKRAGFDDTRHLWPAWFRLIGKCSPSALFGEQVASPDGRAWLDTVSVDLEDAGYAVGSANLCAAGVGAPHIRQRLYFTGRMADGDSPRRGKRRAGEAGIGRDTARVESSGLRHAGWLGNSDLTRSQRRSVQSGDGSGECTVRPSGVASGMADPSSERRQQECGGSHREETAHWLQCALGDHEPASDCSDHWRDLIWLYCSDGKYRPAEPRICPLVTGIPGRVALLRGAGNSIVPQVAATFIQASE